MDNKRRGVAGRKIPHCRVYVGEKLYFMEKETKKILTMKDVRNMDDWIILNKIEDAKVETNIAYSYEKVKF